MLLVDSEIKVFLQNSTVGDDTQTAIMNGSESCITNIGYDLRTNGFVVNSRLQDECELQPGESVFVESLETVRFDHHTIGRLSLKNSRIRMGLTMDSPTYQPGHTTKIYFRLTNISKDAITLIAPEQYVMLIFEQIDKSPDIPYAGTFKDEFSFSGLAGYTSQYADQIKSIEGQIKDLKSLEKGIYGNVITILSIFVAIFALLNVNITMASEAATAKNFFIFNVATLGAVSFLAVLLNELIGSETKKKRGLWLIPAICFVALVIIILTK